MSQVRDDLHAGDAGVASVRERVSEGLRGLFGRVERAGESLAAGAARGRGRAAEAAGGLRRSVPLRHGLAAGERGNLDAALALLREAVELDPQDAESVIALWNVALSCQRPEVAAPAMARWIHAEASSGRRDLAVEHWIELTQQAPDQRVDAPTLVRLLPELRQRLAATRGAEARAACEGLLRRALRESVAPGAEGITPGLALRVLEQARFLDAETAHRAGEIVLSASDLHEKKRQQVESLLAEIDARAKATPRAEESEAPRRAILEVSPVELAARGLIVREAETGKRTRVDLRSVEAIAVGRVDGAGAEPVALVDLVLRGTTRSGGRRILRMRPGAFDAGEVISDAEAGDDPLRSLLGALLDRSGALALPDPDSVLGGSEPPHLDSLEAYEEDLIARLASR